MYTKTHSWVAACLAGTSPPECPPAQCGAALFAPAVWAARSALQSHKSNLAAGLGESPACVVYLYKHPVYGHTRTTTFFAVASGRYQTRRPGLWHSALAPEPTALPAYLHGELNPNGLPRALLQAYNQPDKPPGWFYIMGRPLPPHWFIRPR